MASLTDTLAPVSSSRRIIDPQNNKGESFLGGLANLARGVVGGGSDLYRDTQQRSRQAAATARQAAEDARQATERGAENAAAGFSLDVLSGKYQPRSAVITVETPQPVDTPEGPVPFDAELEGAPPPPGVERVVQEVKMAQAAEDQGRAPIGSANIRKEAALAELRAQYPDQQAIIAKTMRENGIDHYLFREFETEQKVYDSRVDAQLGAFNTYVDAAAKAGAYMPNMTPEQAAMSGRMILEEQDKLERLKTEREMIRQAESDNQQRTRFAQEQFDRQAVGVYTSQVNGLITPIFNYLSSRITEAGMTDDQGNVQSLEKVLAEGLQGIDTITQNAVVRAQADNAGPDVIAAIRAQGQQQRDALTKMWSGDGSQYQLRKQALDNISTVLGIESARAMPVYSGLVDILGQGAVSQIFQGNPAAMLPPGTIDKLKRELSGISGVIDTGEEKATMATVAGILRGDLGIENLNERDASAIMPTLVHTHIGNATDVANGTGNTRAYMNSGFAVVNAAVELQPGRDVNDQRQIAIASTALFSPAHTRADQALMQQDPTQGQTLIAGKRAAATHILNMPTNVLPQYSQMGWEINYVNSGPRAGTYQAQLNQAKYNQNVTRLVQAGRRAVPFDQALRNGPPGGINEAVGARNMALNYMVSTSQYDDDFKGVTAAETRRFFGLGQVPAAMRQRQEAAGSGGRGYAQRDQEFRRTVTQATTTAIQGSANALEERPRSELQAQVQERAAAAGLSWGLVDRLVQKESSWNTGARNGTTGASGLFQINDDVQRTVDQNIDKGIEMLSEAQQGARRVLGRQPQDWETYVMYQQGAGGGAALLNPANAGKSALEVLTGVYGNAATARQAITANGGNVNMTAAQFAQSIGNYFNR